MFLLLNHKNMAAVIDIIKKTMRYFEEKIIHSNETKATFFVSATVCLFFLHCALSNVSSNHLPEKRQSHIGSICLTFLRCAFSNVASNDLPERMQNHIHCMCWTFLHCAFSNISSNCLQQKRHIHIGCIFLKY